MTEHVYELKDEVDKFKTAGQLEKAEGATMVSQVSIRFAGVVW